MDDTNSNSGIAAETPATSATDEELQGRLIESYQHLNNARQEVWDLFQFEEGKYDAYTKRQKETLYGQEQGRKVESLDSAFWCMTEGMGVLYEIIEKRWGIEMD